MKKTADMTPQELRNECETLRSACRRAQIALEKGQTRDAISILAVACPVVKVRDR